jgi:5-histidylcysteine sulfoxide synthase/putative 4-mercaptohistidine N1-methyltranferase
MVLMMKQIRSMQMVAARRMAATGLNRLAMQNSQPGPQALQFVRPKASSAGEMPGQKRQKASTSLASELQRSQVPASLKLHSKKSQQGTAQSMDTKDGYVTLPPLGDLSRGPGKLHGVRTTLLNDNLQKSPAELEVVRAEIMKYFQETYSVFEKLHDTFATSPAFFRKHETLRHPPIFYVGHTAAFYVNKLHLGQYIQQRIDPVLEMQMAVGVDEMSWDDLDSAKYVWPSYEEAEADKMTATEFLQKVINFRKDVRNLVETMIKEQPMEWPIAKDSFWWVILMGIEHERIHLETSSCILRQAPMKFMQPSHYWPTCTEGRFHPDANSSVAQSVPQNSLVAVDKGVTRLGRSWEGTATYGWDNEFGKVQNVEVPAFAASEYLVSNKEYLDFVLNGGYKTQEYWSEEGWSWVSDMKPEEPRYWRQQNGGYYLRTINEEVPMPWDWPVECNNHEAAAFCKYLSKKMGTTIRIPTEDEYMRVRDSEPTDLQNSAHGPAWDVAPANINLEHWASPCPVDMFRSPSGICDVMGNVWQHSATPLDVLEGFAAHPLYDDFTTPTVDSFHSRIMGGSFISTGANGATRDSRYGFRRHFYQHSGFRYVQSERPVDTTVSPFETRRELCNQFRFHFDKPAFGENYPEQLAQVAMEALRKLGRSPQTTSALELGCGPGRTVLELAKSDLFWVNGADLSAKAFNGTSQQLLPGGKLRWTNFTEGEFVDKRECTISELGIEKANDLTVQWHQMPDFAAIDNKKFHSYDLVLCAQPDALTKSDPIGVLSTAHQLLRPGGLLILGTQYDWAPKETFGQKSGEQVVAGILAKWFDPVLEPQSLDFAKAETSRKFECGTQHLTFWQRRESPRDGEADMETAVRETSMTSQESTGQDMYDDDLVIGQYLDFHFGPRSDYPATCAQKCIDIMRQVGQPMGKALEVGGGPGRAAIELSKEFDHVQSGDYSQTFVDLAEKLLKDGELQWKALVDRTSGEVVERSVKAKDLGAGQVSFSWMDAHALPEEKYDLICGFNLIDRLQSPQEFLESIKARLTPGGVLVLSSPYTWLEEFTPKTKWLGGFKYGDNDALSTYNGMKEVLEAAGLKEVKEPEDVWFRIDTFASGSKSQQTQAQMTFWRNNVE